jgi:hypothetical protein
MAGLRPVFGRSFLAGLNLLYCIAFISIFIRKPLGYLRCIKRYLQFGFIVKIERLSKKGNKCLILILSRNK